MGRGEEFGISSGLEFVTVLIQGCVNLSDHPPKPPNLIAIIVSAILIELVANNAPIFVSIPLDLRMHFIDSLG